MTTGPPPKMIVPARYMLAKRSSTSGGALSAPRVERIAMKEAVSHVSLIECISIA